MPRSLDEIIAHYQQAGQQLTMTTPAPPSAMVPSGQAFRPPPYVVPNAYQQTMAMGAPRTIEHYARSQSHTPMGPPPMTPVPPPPMMPSAGIAGSPQFTGSYQSQVMGAVGSLPTSYQGIVNQRAQAAGGTIGRIGGGIAGFAMGGGPQGAMTGEFFGGMVGDVANQIPGVGHALRGYQHLRWGGAMEQMSAANQMRQGTFGSLSLGGRDMGLGGQGMSATAAHRLTQSLGTGQGGLNRQDMVNLTSAASETGFLSQAGNVEQISGVVKNLASLMGEMAKLTGDPDFRTNLQALSRMRNMGLDTGQAVQAMRDQRMFARMAGGMAPAQAGGQMGAAMFQQAGLTPGLGMQLGQGAAGIANLSMGGLSSTQTGLFGGKEGVTGMMAATQAQFMGETSKMILPYIVEKGSNGQLQINQRRLEEVRSGRVGMQTIASRGAANMGRMGFGSMQDLLAQAPELQTQMGQQLGEIGTFTMIANQVKDIQAQNPSLTLDTAAALVTGSGARGRLLANQMRNPEMLSRMQSQLDEQIRQEKFAGRQQRLRQLEQTPGVLGRMAENARLKVASMGLEDDPWDILGGQRRSEQSAEAFRDAAERQRAEEEALGIRRVQFGLGAQFSEKERKLAVKKLGRISRLGSVAGAGGTSRAGGVDVRGGGEEMQDIMGTGIMMPTGRQRLLQGDIEASDVLRGTGEWYQTGGVLGTAMRIGAGSMEEVQRAIEADAAAAKLGGGLVRQSRELTEAQFEGGEKQVRSFLKKRLGAPKMINAMAKMKASVLAYAQRMGGENRSLDPREMQKLMINSLVEGGGMSKADARKLVRKNGNALKLHAFHWVDKSRNPVALRALLKTDDAGGMALQAQDQEAIETNIKVRTEDLNEQYKELGFAASDNAPTEPEEAGIRALSEEEDPKARALAMLIGGAGGAGVSEEATEAIAKLEGQLMDDPKGAELLKKARKLSSKMKDPAQRARLAQKYGKRLASGELTLEKMGGEVEKGLGGRRELAAFQAELKRRKMEEVETGAGAGAGTTESGKRVKSLEDQKVMLTEMASGLNKASTELLSAAKMLKGEQTEKEILKQASRAFGFDFTGGK